jgi:hypothetical protein
MRERHDSRAWLVDIRNNGHLSTRTVRNRLKSVRLKSRRVIKRPLLADRHRRSRLAWCLVRRGWNLLPGQDHTNIIIILCLWFQTVSNCSCWQTSIGQPVLFEYGTGCEWHPSNQTLQCPVVTIRCYPWSAGSWQVFHIVGLCVFSHQSADCSIVVAHLPSNSFEGHPCCMHADYLPYLWFWYSPSYHAYWEWIKKIKTPSENKWFISSRCGTGQINSYNTQNSSRIYPQRKKLSIPWYINT